jgi:xanthine/CO dehydrogenase XdhC/CoxF family maturation factor
MPAETRQLLQLWSSARARGLESALATVVRIDGSSYRKPGARMLITRDGQRAGTVSGGCLEAEVTRKIWWLTERGPCVNNYTTSFDDDSYPSYGLGCNGSVTLLLERAEQAEAVHQTLRASIEDREPSAVVTVVATTHPDAPLGSRLVHSSRREAPVTKLPPPFDQLLLQIAKEALLLRESRAIAATIERSSIELFAEYVAPPPALFVFGAGDDAQPVVHLAHSMGWQVTVADGRAHLATPARFPAAHRVAILNLDQPLANLSIGPDDAAVVLTHSYQQDLAILRALLPRNLAYLGVLGPRRRTAKIIDEVTAGASLNAERAMRSIKSPVGLDLGVGSPQVIALSIIAEIQAVLSRRSASPLHLVGAAQPAIPTAVPAAVNG